MDKKPKAFRNLNVDSGTFDLITAVMKKHDIASRAWFIRYLVLDFDEHKSNNGIHSNNNGYDPRLDAIIATHKKQIDMLAKLMQVSKDEGYIDSF